MATNFMDLTPEQRGYLVKRWISNITEVPTPIGDNGDAARFLEVLPGTIKQVQNLPTDAELVEFKQTLLMQGNMNPIFQNAILLNNKSIGNLIQARDLTLGKDARDRSIRLRGADVQSEQYRKLGFEEEEVTNEMKQQAVTKPADFIMRKNNDIANINQQAFKAYTKAYTSFRDFGYSDDTAFKKAKTAAQSYKNELMKVHNKQFSETLVNDAKSRIGQNVN